MNASGIHVLVQPGGEKAPLVHRALAQARAIGRYRELVRHLIRNTLSKESTGTVFGALWWLVDPLILMGVYVFFVDVILHSGIKNFALFVLIGVIAWKHVSSGILAAIQETANREYAMRQVPFPRGVLPLAAVAAETVHLFIGIAIYVPVAMLLGVFPTVVFPFVFVLIAVQVVLVLGFAYALAAWNIYFRDVQNLTSYALRIGLFLSPVLYQTTMVPAGMRRFYDLNPFATLVPAYRDVLIYGNLPSLAALAGVALFATTALVGGFLVFTRLEPSFAKVN